MKRPAHPELRTERLLLRGFGPDDVEVVQSLAGEREIARNTLNIPHPYTRDDAERWIASHAGQLQRREAVTFAIARADDGTVLGAVGLIIDAPNDVAELGYWIGKPFWGNGYATEAAGAVLRWGFRELGLHRIHAGHFPHNPASGRVLRKIGMRYEGRARGHVKKWGEHLDLERFGVLESDLRGESG